MYELMRNEFLIQLSDLPKQELERVIGALDRVAAQYEITRKTDVPAEIQPGLPDLVKLYLACKKMYGFTECSAKNYGIALRVFFQSVNKPPGEITPNDVRVFLRDYQESRGISLGSMDKYRCYIASFFNWANEEGYIQSNPFRSIPVLRYERKPRKALNQIELEYLRLSCKTIREKAIVEFLYSTGCRVSELAGIKLSDINWRDKSVHLFGKGRKHRTSFLNAKAEITLSEYLKTRNDDCEFVFVSQRKPIRQLKTAAIQKIIRGITQRSTNDTVKEVTPHILRHTMATAALQGGMPVVEVSKLLGHENIDTTLIYAKSSYSDIQANHKKYVI